MKLAAVVRRKMINNHPFDEQYAELWTAALEKPWDARASWESLLDIYAWFQFVQGVSAP
jgi:hypothetical protein